MSATTVSNVWQFSTDAIREACLAALIAGDPTSTSTVSGTTLTTDITHNFKYIKCTSSSAVTITLADDVDGSFTGSERIFFIQYGTGALTFVPDTGVTLRCSTATTTRTQYSTACLARIGANEWLLFGDLLAYVPLDAPEW